MDLPFNKIIVGSRHASAGTSSSFEISLPETLSLPHNAVCYVCDLQVTNTFSSVDFNKRTLYFIENELSQSVLKRVFLDQQMVRARLVCNRIADTTKRIFDISPRARTRSIF